VLGVRPVSLYDVAVEDSSGKLTHGPLLTLAASVPGSEGGIVRPRQVQFVPEAGVTAKALGAAGSNRQGGDRTGRQHLAIDADLVDLAVEIVGAGLRYAVLGIDLQRSDELKCAGLVPRVKSAGRVESSIDIQLNHARRRVAVMAMLCHLPSLTGLVL